MRCKFCGSDDWDGAVFDIQKQALVSRCRYCEQVTYVTLKEAHSMGLGRRTRAAGAAGRPPN